LHLNAGTRLGPYEILALLGSGGMGEVYRAHDTKLGRDVAIKVLPESLAHDADRLARFEREAQVLASLNHPNIAHIHGFEDSTGVRALVMELVEGLTLADRVASGPISIDEALPIAQQIAEALEGAHQTGVIHRDLKPANIKITPASVVKVLDFGLAKLARTDRATPDLSQLPTVTVGGTRDGIILGTAPYMSPEQARGKPIDRRTDIWAFGCVLYEMLSGRRAFRGETSSDVIASILDHEPDWTALPRDVPASVRRLLEQCLVKDPKRRLRDIGQAWVELDAAFAERTASPAPMLPATKRSRQRLAIPAALLVLLVAALIAFTWSRSATRPTAAARPATFLQLTDAPGPELYPSLSPDGTSFVYQSRAAGKWDIYSQRVGGRNAVNLTAGSTDDNTQPTFSPDGQHIAFRSERDGGGIFVMGATGEDVKRLTDICYNPAWSPDGREIICSTGSFTRPEETRGGHMIRVNTSTGDKQPIPGAIRESLQPHGSPHGSRIAYWARQTTMNRDLFTVSTSGGDPVPVTGDAFVDWNPTWSPDGRYLYFSSDRGGSMNLWRVRIDEQSG
jgi:serine/threonine protein kinase